MTQGLVIAGGQRLLDEFDAHVGTGSEHHRKGVRRPALVGVDDETALRCRRAYAPQPVGIAVAAELQLQKRTMRGAGRSLAPWLRACRDSAYRRSRRACGSCSPASCHTGRSARFASRSQSAQSSALRAACGATHFGTSARSMPASMAARASSSAAMTPRNGFRIARIGNAFAASRVVAIVERHHHDVRLGLAAARNGEAAGDGPAFGGNGQAHVVRPQNGGAVPRPAA